MPMMVLLRFAPSEQQSSSRYKHQASVLVNADGRIVAYDKEQKLESSGVDPTVCGESKSSTAFCGTATRGEETEQDRLTGSADAHEQVAGDAGLVKVGQWSVITANIDCGAGSATFYVNGALSSQSTGLNPQLLALGSTVTLFGGGKAAQHLGGSVRLLSIRRGALLSKDEVQGMSALCAIPDPSRITVCSAPTTDAFELRRKGTRRLSLVRPLWAIAHVTAPPARRLC